LVEVQENLLTVRRKAKTLKVLKLLAQHLNAYISRNSPPVPEQRVERGEQRVITNTGQEACPAIQKVKNSPPSMLANNPTTKRVLQSRARTHQCTTQRNTPGGLPKITHPVIIPLLLASTPTLFAVPHIIEDMPPSTKAHKVPQQQAWKT
jgi:hypothetical protein